MKTCILALAFVLTGAGVYAQQEVNPCIVCPNGATAGDDFAPYADDGDFTTCALLIDFAKLFETESAYCGLFGEEIKSYCCPPETTTPMTTPIITPTTPNPSTAPSVVETYYPTDPAMIPAPTPMPTEGGIDASTSDTTATAMNQCIICPDGITAGYNDVAPYADDGDSRTCAQLIGDAKVFAPGSEDCAFAEIDELFCCVTEIENPCIICPNGATVGDDYFPPGYEDYDLTCAELIDYATQFETESDYCGVYGEEEKSYCCPPETPAPNPMPVNDTTVATTMTTSTNVTGTTTLLWVLVISAIAGVCLIALAVNYLRKRAAKVQEGAPLAPFDSSLPADVCQNNANVLCDSLPSARSIATKSVAALDEWSICDEDVMHSSHFKPHSLLTDCEDSITATSSFDAELAQDLYTINDSMFQSAQKEQMSQTTNIFTRLFDNSEAEILGPKPNSPSGPKLFSCKTLGKSKATEATCKASGNVYQVRAPPGPLGIVIESSKDGPVICKVNEGSPLHTLVEPGDTILTVDGFDCRDKDAHTFAQWITTKPWVPETVLELRGDADALTTS